MSLDASQFIVRAMIDEGRLTQEQADEAASHAQAAGCGIVESLVQTGVLSQRDVAIENALICEYPYIELDAFNIDIRNSRYLPQRMAEELAVFPLFVIDKVATVAMADPLNLNAIDRLNQALRCRIDPVLCDTERLKALIARAYSLASAVDGDESGRQEEESLASADEPIVVAVNQILYSAADAGASDIHINPDETRLHLRYRVDGVLQAQQGPDVAIHAGIVQRLKVMARLDLTQTRRPQDGKFRFTFKGTHIDVRLSLLPTVHGENVVMRLLRPAAQIGDINDMGMPPDMTAYFEQMINKPHGIILVTGPTGSGKTTTLYTALHHINTPDRNIMTIEDPVEIRLPVIRQVQANAEIGLTFASALRSILRQDPDVILVGEIRDEETAKIAVQAALTGHLVFSTLHTNDAVGSIARLRDFGLPSFAINNAMLGAIAQRLVRRVCEHCTQPHAPTPEQLSAIACAPSPADLFVKGRGCSKCMSTGYKGRLGVFEMFRVTPSIRKLIEEEATGQELLAQAKLGGMRSMLDDGVDKARLGLTTVEELSKLNATISEDLSDKSKQALSEAA